MVYSRATYGDACWGQLKAFGLNSLECHAQLRLPSGAEYTVFVSLRLWALATRWSSVSVSLDAVPPSLGSSRHVGHVRKWCTTYKLLEHAGGRIRIGSFPLQ